MVLVLLLLIGACLAPIYRLSKCQCPRMQRSADACCDLPERLPASMLTCNEHDTHHMTAGHERLV